VALRRSPACPLHGALLLLSAMIAACSSPAPPAIPLAVEYAGCKAVLVPGPICVLDSERELRLWVGAPPDARIAIQAGEHRIVTAGELIRGGRRFSLRIPRGAKKLGVLVEAGKREASWSLSFAEQAGRGKLRDVLGEISRKTTLLYEPLLAGDLATVRETLTRLRLPADAPAECRYYLSYYQGLLGENEGDYRSALARYQEAAEIAERLALNRLRWLAEEELAVVLREVGRSRESAQLFERLHRKSYAKNPSEEAQLLTNQAWSALLAREAGESVADPAPLLERALELHEVSKSTRTGKKANLLLNLALAHLWEGRLQQAKQLLVRAHELEPHPPISHKLWWLDLEARIALREGRPTEALHRFDDLGELARETSSADGRLRAAFGQARSLEALRNQAAALETLRRAEILLDEQSLQIPIYEGRDTFVATRQAIVNLHVELLLGQGRNAQALEAARHARSRVLRQLEHGDRLANLTPDQRTRWARILTDYQRKRTTLEERAKNEWRLPTDQVGFERDKRRGEAEAAKLLLDEAFRILGDSGERPGGVLPPPRPGELILAYHPLPSGWVGFAADGETVTVRRFELPPGVLARPAELARLLLLPFRSSIEKAERIRILPSGSLQSVDFHALPFEGDVLLARGPVVYGLDLPVSAEPAHTSGRRALLVADPRNDLPGTLAEVRTVRKVLASGPRPWITEELKNAAASAEAVRVRLPAADLLHYAGHGIFSGFGGWESGLLLAEESQLIPGDLLALDRVPAWVVLSACDTGQSSTETPVESLGLAHAFLLAGSRAVVASTRIADDREMPPFFGDLYRQWERGPDLALALQRAQLAWRQRSPEADWASFRLFEP
jgi:cellulose synthase operon protein C